MVKISYTVNKSSRIVKNTILLYGRTLFTLFISLYTSRLILEALGVEDYGIYNVVGGLVAMFSILSSSLSSAISRYITYGIGKKEIAVLKEIFSTCIGIQFLIAVIVFLVIEVLGVYFLNNKLNIPPNKLYAANWVLQFSNLTFFIGLISVPYNACIIAHEHMGVFAVVSIFEALFKLGLVILVYFSSWNKLILYSFLLFLLSFIIRIIYGVYCRHKFIECTYQFHFNKKLFVEIFKFAGWGFLGNTAYILNTQGVNMTMNMFFNVTYNAARGVVAQVENAVMQFVNNFTMALTPQITKSYAEGDLKYTENLVYQGAKFSFYLLLLFLIPIEFETETLLNLWLKVVPEETTLFLRLSLICTAITLIGNTSLTAIMATGSISNYQIVVSIVGCTVFPITWFLYKMGEPAYITYIVYAIVYFFINFIRLRYLKILLGFQPNHYILEVLIPISFVTILAIIPSFVICNYFVPGLFRLIVLTCCNLVVSPIIIFYLGIKHTDRVIVKNSVKAFINRFHSK